MSKIDLHLHSHCSADAHHSPEELIDFCLAAGVHTAAVADHNTTAGVRTAQARAKQAGVVLVPAVELDCLYEQTELHVLGYWIDPEDAALLDNARAVHEMWVQNASESIRLIQEYGIYADKDEIMRRSPDGVVTGELICEVALEDARNRNNPLMRDYYPGGLHGHNAPIQFALNLCGQGKAAHVPVAFIPLAGAVGLIRRAGGIAVLAHPAHNIGRDEARLRAIIAQGVCGVEAYSTYHSAEDILFFRHQAEGLGLAVSCGSDFHGRNKPTIQVGCVDCGGREEELWQSLLAKRDG